MSRRWALLASALLIGLSTLFCTIGPSDGGPGSPSASLRDGERIAALDDVTAVVQGSLLPDGKIDRAALLSHLTSDSHFAAAGNAPDGSIWANFADGRMVIIPPEIPAATGAPFTPPPLPEEDTPSGMAPATEIPSAAAVPERASTGRHIGNARVQGTEMYGLPASEVAVEMNTLGGRFSDASWWFHRFLAKHKYESKGPSAATIEALAAVQNVGVFYLNTHGGLGCKGTFTDCLARHTPTLRTPGAPPYGLTYALWTSTPVTPANEATYSSQVAAGLLAYMLADPGDGKPNEWRYAITADFVKARMTFSDNSLVYIDACGSQDGGLAQAFAQAHASWFIGWSQPTNSSDSSFYFIDRMLGVGLDIYFGVPKDEPPNRPFDVSSVMTAMNRTGKSIVVSAGPYMLDTSMLSARQLGGAVAILRPSIRRLVVHEEDKELEILGAFGGERGSVTIDKVELTVKEWASDRIRVNLPAANAPGGRGEVVVRVRQHESNAVPLTQWYVQFTYTEEPDFEMQGYNWLYLDVYWRADVHPYRVMPDDPWVYDQEAVILEPGEGSSGHWECDWTGTVGSLSISTVEGEGDLPFTREPGEVGFTSTAELKPEEKQITNLSFSLNFDPEHTCVTETTGAGITVRTVGMFVLLPSLLEEVHPDHPMTPPLTLDGQWVLEGAYRDLMGDGSWPWLKWSDTAGEPAPKQDKTPG